MSDIPKRADKAIGLLEDLVELLHYFYMDHSDFRKDVLAPATEIENILKDLAVNKKETFRRIAKKYEEYYKKKQKAIENTVVGVTDEQITDSLRERYNEIKDDI